MNFQLTQEQEMLVEAVRSFVAKELLPHEEAVDRADEVSPELAAQIRGKAIAAAATDKTDRIYIAYHKPIGITCTTLQTVAGNITDAINHPQRIFPIGRLDKPSEGLIFLTSDGDIVNKILRAENNHDKEYIVHVNQDITLDFIKKMAAGVKITNMRTKTRVVTKKCEVTQLGSRSFSIVLTQGLNRQIRRMCSAFDYNVVKLKRVKVMSLTLDGLNTGAWRNLTSKEVGDIKKQY